MILRKFIFLKEFEPRDSYKKNSDKKTVYVYVNVNVNVVLYII